MNFNALISSKKWLHLVSIAEEGEKGLRAIISYAEDGGPLPREIVGKHVCEIMKQPIEYGKAPHFELHWARYLMFSVRDESFADNVGVEEFEGQAIRKFRKSWFLDSIPMFINSPEILPSPVVHIGVYCLNRIVDVLAYGEPVVTQLKDA